MEDYRVGARRLVGTLDAAELQILRCLIGGMSGRDIAAFTGNRIGDVELIQASLMNKLSAKRIADAVRVGLHAGVDHLD